MRFKIYPYEHCCRLSKLSLFRGCWSVLCCYFTFSLAVLLDAVVCKDGHTLCNKCLNRAIGTGNRTCPVDRSNLGLQEPSRNQAMHAMIQILTIKRPTSFEAEGIGNDWTGPLETAESHSRDCGMKMMKCPNLGCSVQIYQSEIKVHEEKCSHRQTRCEQCHQDFKVVFRGAHQRRCPKIVIECPNNCGEQILRYIHAKVE